MIFKTVLGTYSKNKITLHNDEQLKAIPFSPDAKIISGKKGFFMLRSPHGNECEDPIVIENYVLLSDEDYEQFTQNEKRET